MIVALLVAAALAVPASTDPGEPELDTLRKQFHLLGPTEVRRRLEPLARGDRTTDSASQARLWLGDLSLARGATVDARHWYEFALAHATTDVERGRGHRGLADSALVEGHPRQALKELELALELHPVPTVRLELEEKQTAARLSQRLGWADAVAWGILVAFLVAAVIQLRQARRSLTLRIRVPVEIWFLLPVYLLFFGVAFGRDEAMARTVVETILGAFLVISLAAAIPLARRTPAQLAQLAGTVIANVAVLYLAVRHAQLMERLLQSG